MRSSAMFCVVLLLICFATAQTDKANRPSPPGHAELQLNGKTISVDYSRPKIRDPKTAQPRKIFGELVPFGKVWRTGANEATTLKTDADLVIGGTNLPRGTYTLYTLPTEEKWTLIISKATGQWGIPYPGEEQDFARVPMQVQRTSKTVDPFTITVDKADAKANAAQLCVAWENTRGCVPLQAK